MALTKQSYSHNALFYVQIAGVDDEGYPMGTVSDPDAVGTNTTHYPLVLDGVIDLVPGTPSRATITVLGGQKVISETVLPATDYGAPQFQLAHRNEKLHELLTNTAVDIATNTAAAISAENAKQSVFRKFLVMFNIQVTNSDTGQIEWLNKPYLSARVNKNQPAGAAQVTGDVTNPNPEQYTLSLALSNRDVSGYPLGSLTTTVDEDSSNEWRTNKPLTFTTFIDDGVTSTLTLQYRPISEDATGAAENNVTLEGIGTTVDGVGTVNAQVTFAPGTSAHRRVVLHQTDFKTP